MKREKHWLNRGNTAASLGISVQSFSAWGVEPVARIGRESFYVMADVLKNREANWLAKAAGNPRLDDDELQTAQLVARIKLTEAQADAQEMKNEIARHEVAPFAFIVFALGKTANEIAGVMDSLPVELMRKLTLQTKDVEKVRAVTALASDAICNLGSVEFLESALAEYLEQQQ